MLVQATVQAESALHYVYCAQRTYKNNVIQLGEEPVSSG